MRERFLWYAVHQIQFHGSSLRVTVFTSCCRLLLMEISTLFTVTVNAWKVTLLMVFVRCVVHQVCYFPDISFPNHFSCLCIHVKSHFILFLFPRSNIPRNPTRCCPAFQFHMKLSNNSTRQYPLSICHRTPSRLQTIVNQSVSFQVWRQTLVSHWYLSFWSTLFHSEVTDW